MMPIASKLWERMPSKLSVGSFTLACSQNIIRENATQNSKMIRLILNEKIMPIVPPSKAELEIESPK